ncbi:hypothetical protein, partial [Staphylococcus sp. EG-SA-15]|uniref:hypothetical protein n=1 Tax=Staphylococcus sp. EG-SA-15 TaxID=2767492 RepID=UPI00197CC933
YVMHLGVACQYPQLAHHNFFFTENAYLNYQQVFHEKVLPDDPGKYRGEYIFSKRLKSFVSMLINAPFIFLYFVAYHNIFENK